MSKPTERLKVQIGDSSREFALARTSAPPAYDAGTSLTLYDSGEEEDWRKRERYVLIETSELRWHEGRYRSGLHTFEVLPFEEIGGRGEIEARLWARLYGENQ